MPEWNESEIIYISMLEHYCYCPRQCALIHIEQIFEDNIYTMRGSMLHQQVDEPDSSIEGEIRIEHAVPLWSNRLGLIGKADVVEFHPDGIIYPVEYKHGARRQKQHDDIQLCAQVLCLEEMLGKEIQKGAIFHHASRRRREVEITLLLRQTTEKIIPEIRSMIATNELPPPVDDQRCPNCSLIDLCMPGTTSVLQRQKRTLNIYQPFPERENW